MSSSILKNESGLRKKLLKCLLLKPHSASLLTVINIRMAG